MWKSAYIYLPHGVYSLEMDMYIGKTLSRIPKEDKFFFIRYADDGTHLRFRFFKDMDLKSFFFNNISRDHDLDISSINNIRKYFNAPPITHPFTIKLVDYSKEYNRYGGPHGIGLAEEDFCNSSRFSVDYLRHFANNPYHRFMLGIYIFQSYFFSYTKRKCSEEATLFFYNLCTAYLDAEVGHGSTNKSGVAHLNTHQEALHSNVIKYLSSFDSFFQYNQEKCLEYVSKSLSLNMFIELENYKKNITEVKKAYFSLALEGTLILEGHKKMSSHQKLLSVCASLIHMFSNRIGFHLVDEAWIAYLIHKYYQRESDAL